MVRSVPMRCLPSTKTKEPGHEHGGTIGNQIRLLLRDARGMYRMCTVSAFYPLFPAPSAALESWARRAHSAKPQVTALPRACFASRGSAFESARLHWMFGRCVVTAPTA